jgi:DNA-binding CsgD family transcriptional regulator/tetratricopeptide (TPR) repeat protein
MAAAAVGIVGRTTEKKALDALVAALASGQGGVCWISGEPGIGKSTLVDALTAEAVRRGLPVLRGGGDELMSAFPLRLMADCLGIGPRTPDLLRQQISQLLRGESSGSTLDPVLAAGERMLELVDRSTTDTPLVLVTEDLQWGDEPSLLLWDRLARGTDQLPLLLVGTCRPVPRRPTVSRLAEAVRERDGVVLELDPLDHPNVLEIAQGFVSAPAGPRLSAELARAGGNPLYVRELVEALLLDDVMEVSGGVADLRPGTAAAPHTLTAAIGRRVSFLSEETAQVLRMAALLGGEFDLDELAALTERPPTALAHAMGEAVAAAVLSDTAERLAFRHDLIRQVLYEQTPAPVRGALQNQVARHLADTGAGLDRIAQHLLAAPGDLAAWAVDGLVEAPATLLYTAPQAAAELLTRGMRTVPDGDPRWEELADRLVQVSFWLGRDREVIETGDAVVRRTADLERGVQMRLTMMRAAGRAGRFEDALAAVSPVATDERLAPRWQARLGASRAMALVYLQRPEDARETAEAALREARECGDAVAAAYALSALAPISDATTQLAVIEEALATLDGAADDPDSMDLRMMVSSNYISRLSVAGRRDDMFAAVRRTLVAAERIGTYRYAMLLGTAATVSYAYGQWDEALVHLASVGPEFLTNPALRHSQGVAALILLHREQRDKAESHLRAARLDQYIDAVPIRYSGAVTEAAAILAELAGDPDRALALRASWLDVPPGPLRETGYLLSPQLVRLALAAGDTATAQAALAACEQTPDATGAVRLAGLCCRAMLYDDAAALVSVAEEQYAGGWPLDAGFSWEEAAIRFADAGDTSAARKALTDAAHRYHELGATWDIRRADARLRPYGIRRGPRSLHRRATTGWEALTPSEARIARLVAKGMSNPAIAAELFLSRNTVQTHVSNILAKLQMRSRLELVRDATAVTRRS